MCARTWAPAGWAAPSTGLAERSAYGGGGTVHHHRHGAGSRIVRVLESGPHQLCPARSGSDHRGSANGGPPARQGQRVRQVPRCGPISVWNSARSATSPWRWDPRCVSVLATVDATRWRTGWRRWSRTARSALVDEHGGDEGDVLGGVDVPAGGPCRGPRVTTVSHSAGHRDLRPVPGGRPGGRASRVPRLREIGRAHV